MRSLINRSSLTAGTALAVAGLVGALSATATAQDELGTLRFVTGPAGGTYYPLGEGLVAALNEHSPGARASATPTGGSTENARLIALNEADFGWAAGDVVYYAYTGGREFSEPLENLRTVTAGHASAGHLVVPADSDIHDAADLEGASIGVGDAGSSNAQAAAEWLTTVGLSQDDVDFQFISTNATADALRDGAIDAGFQLSGTPSSLWTELLADHPMRLVEISDDDMAALNERLPFYVPYTIEAGTYPGQDEDVSTIGVNVMLITRDDTPDFQVTEQLRMFFEHNEQLQMAHSAAEEWNTENASSATAIPLHDAAAAYFDEHGIDY